ncbi:hypothetical protein OG407_09465 [Streptomyces sp. NBC_01515]|uniref:hypothetical protein n=1 Tax=Streptomyces sp. NBC_01515 TaxID=2903890 RepID=UPI0038678728
MADALEAQAQAQAQAPGDLLIPHPDTLEVINGRRTRRGQLNYAVPNALQLQQRVRRYNAVTDIAHGDIVALALDIFLRAKGYPPDLSSPKSDGP